MKKTKILFFLFVFLTIALLLIYYFININSKNYDNLKIDSSKEIIYTDYINQAGDYYQYIPTLNIKNRLGTEINQNIQEFVKQFEKKKIGITYEYNLNGEVLSLVIKVHDHSYAESATILSFQAYNIDLKNIEIVSNNTLFQYFNINENDIQNSLSNGFINYYEKLVKEDIIDSNQCDYNCFINGREFNIDLQDVQYYVRDGKLIAFKPYISFSYHEESEQIYDFEIIS